MSKILSPRAVALTDQILATLDAGAGTTDEIAERVGNVACKCLVNGRAGVRRSGTPCTCVRTTGVAGWRRACGFDVYRHLVRLEQASLIVGTRDPARRQVCWRPAAVVATAA
jgi:hypothetical protein